ncbi:Uncharacterised protein [Mycobacteroides abscessus subsp. abscessus]|nr:Uncharacterised protein [Mycobacteroides abscessus subsp. abscessus]
MINRVRPTRVPSANTFAASDGGRWWNDKANTTRSNAPSGASIAVASMTRTLTRGSEPIPDAAIPATEEGSMSVTVIEASGRSFSSSRDSPPWAAPSSSTRGLSIPTRNPAACSAFHLCNPFFSPRRSSDSTTDRFFAGTSSRSKYSSRSVCSLRSHTGAPNPARGIESISAVSVMTPA